MPLISPDFRPLRLLSNRHLQTIYPALFRKVSTPHYTRERLELPDGDFLDVDWMVQGGKGLVILCHGLEGNSGKAYVRGMASAFHRRGWDALAINFRGCSGEPNRLYRSYHSGETGDLGTVVEWVANTRQYDKIALVGFSLGGNVVLKYLGEKGSNLPAAVACAATVSVPCDLADACRSIGWLYSKRFLSTLVPKLQEKFTKHCSERLPELANIRKLQDFDDLYTGPAHGFRDALDYYTRCSSKLFVADIRIPTLLINALDDPFFGPGCYPYEQAKQSAYFHFMPTPQGGHVGFTHFQKEEYWTEQQVTHFVLAHA